MNRYGAEALRHWQRYLPTKYSRLADPVTFFTDLGEQADAEIEDRYLEYAGPEIPGESAETKQARLTQAMNRAVEEVFAELVTPSPASKGEPDPEEIPPARAVLDELGEGQSDTATGGYRIAHWPASSSLFSYRPLRPGMPETAR